MHAYDLFIYTYILLSNTILYFFYYIIHKTEYFSKKLSLKLYNKNFKNKALKLTYLQFYQFLLFN